MKTNIKRVFLKTIVLFVFTYIHIISASADEMTSGRVLPIPIPSTPPEDAPHIDKDSIYTALGYEYGWVTIGERDTVWEQGLVRAAYLYKDLQLPYIQAERYVRSDEVDYIYSLGGYYQWNRTVYAQFELGFGQDVTYVYKNRIRAQLEGKILDGLFARGSYTFSSYDAGDVNTPAAGVTYYFGKHYFMGDVLIPFTEDRGNSYAIVLRFNSDWTERFGTYIGTAVGTRLYDVYPLPDAADQKGFMIFAGIKLTPFEDFIIRAGYSYAQEDPSFSINSISTLLSYQF